MMDMHESIKVNDCVWYNDFGYVVLEIKGKEARIKEMDSSYIGRNYIPGGDDIWVPLTELELWSEEDYVRFWG